MSTVYVCGPMSGYKDHNEPAFREAAQLLKAIDEVPVVPHDIEPMSHEGLCPQSHVAQTTGGHDVACYLRADLVHLLLHCDRVYVLSGWERSVGARIEVQVAAACGLPLEFQS